MLERLAKWLIKYLVNKNNALSATLQEKLSVREFYISDIRYAEDSIRMHRETLAFKESTLAELAYEVQELNNKIELKEAEKRVMLMSNVLW